MSKELDIHELARLIAKEKIGIGGVRAINTALQFIEDMKALQSLPAANIDGLAEQIMALAKPDVPAPALSAYLIERYRFHHARLTKLFRWLLHCERAYHLPSRKLRKCQMRSYQRRKRLLLRKIARSDAVDKAWRLV